MQSENLSLVPNGIEPYPPSVLMNLQHVHVNENMLIAHSKTEFFMPAGTHSHSEYEFYFPQFAGQPHIFNNKTIVLNKNRVVPINPYVIHGLEKEVPKFAAMDIMMEKKFVEELSTAVFGHPQIEFKCEEYKVEPELDSLIRTFMNESANAYSGAKFALQSLAVLIVVYFFRHFKSNRAFPVVERKYQENQGLKRAIEYINDESCADYSLDQAASLANLSRYHFIRVFKAFTGKTPYDYMMEIKIEKAKKMLSFSSRNITEIACSCGFNNPSHFSSVFKKRTGLSPKQYRFMSLV